MKDCIAILLASSILSLVNKLPWRLCKKIIANAVAIEREFVRDALPVRLIGMNADLMCQYIEFVADRLLSRFRMLRKYINATNPFDFMDLISMPGKDEFL